MNYNCCVSCMFMLKIFSVLQLMMTNQMIFILNCIVLIVIHKIDCQSMQLRAGHVVSCLIWQLKLPAIANIYQLFRHGDRTPVLGGSRFGLRRHRI